MWSGFCSYTRKCCDRRGTTRAGGTPPPGKTLAPWELPCRRRRAAVALTVYGRALLGGTRRSLYQARRRYPDGDPAAAGGRAGRALELCWYEGESTMGVDCDGRRY